MGMVLPSVTRGPVLHFGIWSCNRFSGELPDALSGKGWIPQLLAPSRGTPTAVPVFHFPVL